MSPHPISILACVLLTLGLWPSQRHAIAAGTASRPNVILVITDDQGYGDLGCHGNTMIRTPNLDRLYGQSVRLTDFHVSPCCTPTRAGLMTGQNPVRVGAWGTTWGRSMPCKDAVTMADVFVGSGYQTGFFGKWHLGDSYPFRPQDRGFREVLAHGGGGVGQTPDYWGNDYFDDTYFHNGEPRKFPGYCTDIWFDGAFAFIEANKERPFFVYLSTNAPHGPLNVDPKYSDPYVQQGVPANMAKFYGMIENIDENMGRLMTKLDTWGLAEDTMLIFMTDNGTANGIVGTPKKPKRDSSATSTKWTGFNAGMRGRKGSIHDGGHRVPCFVRWPSGGLDGGRDVDTLTAHVDVLPTLIRLCNLKEPGDAEFDGTNIAPLLNGQPVEWPDRTLVVQYRQSHDPPLKWNAAVVTERWRLVGGSELHDIQSDPGQTTNIAKQHLDVVAQLREDYEVWWTGVSSRFDEYCRIILGADEANPTTLNAFDWHTRTPWNQGHIRAGAAANGFWAVEIAQAGEYEFALRRWPAEVDAPITAVIDGGKSIDATTARLKIGDIDLTKPIPAGATQVTFTVQLEAAEAKLQTWLTDKQTGASRGAYYVTVKRLTE